MILQQQIRATEEYIAKRIAALYKLNLIGPLHILASAESVYDLIYRKFAMERILEYDDEVLARHKANKEKLVAVLRELDHQKNEKVSLESDLRKETQMMSKKGTIKKNLLQDIQNKKTLVLAAVDSLKQAAIALDQTILSLHVEPDVTADKPKDHFNSFKGLLKMPVRGKIISFFGPYKKGKYKVVNYRSGIEIKADRGEPIQAVHSGIVLYSGWFKNYGNMIIIDHGDHYYTLYAHAEELFKSKGDYVESEEVIATVGDTASMTGSNLYFEVRHRGEPMNPLNWLRDS
ncbi:MAG: peptidoglycan DD-metalloendopeptidase family protein [Pseudomonadota bacterium]